MTAQFIRIYRPAPIQWLLLLLLLLLLPMVPLHAQGWEQPPHYRYRRGGLRQVMRIISCEEFDEPSRGYARFRRTTSTAQLLRLTYSSNPARRLYAAYALADRHYPRLYEVFATLLRQDVPDTLTREVVPKLNNEEPLYLAQAFRDRIVVDKVLLGVTPPLHQAPVDSLRQALQLHRIDSVALAWASRGHYMPIWHLLRHCLADNNGYPGSYAYVRQLCQAISTQQRRPAVFPNALAAYQQQEDIQLLQRFGERTIDFVARFPDPAFRPLVQQHRFREHSHGLMAAAAAYQDAWGAHLLDSLQRHLPHSYGGSLSNFLHVVDQYYYPGLDSVVVHTWQRHRRLSPTRAAEFIRQDSARAAALFKRVLLGFTPSWKEYDLLDIPWGETGSIAVMRSMLQTIHNQDSAAFRAVVQHGARVFRGYELDALVAMGQPYGLEYLPNELLQALVAESDTYGIYCLSMALLSYPTPALHQQLGRILAAKTTNGPAKKDSWLEALNYHLPKHGLVPIPLQ